MQSHQHTCLTINLIKDNNNNYTNVDEEGQWDLNPIHTTISNQDKLVVEEMIIYRIEHTNSLLHVKSLALKPWTNTSFYLSDVLWYNQGDIHQNGTDRRSFSEFGYQFINYGNLEINKHFRKNLFGKLNEEGKDFLWTTLTMTIYLCVFPRKDENRCTYTWKLNTSHKYSYPNIEIGGKRLVPQDQVLGGIQI